MTWEAKSSFIEIKVGTRLCIYKNGQISGNPKEDLIGNHDISIEMGDNQRQNAKIINADGKQAILVLQNGNSHEISIKKDGEFDSGITLRAMYYDDWIVRT